MAVIQLFHADRTLSQISFSFTYRDSPMAPLNSLLNISQNRMSKSLATPILHFAQGAHVNNPLFSIYPLANSLEEVCFLSLVCSDTSANRASKSNFFFLLNYYIYREAAYSEVPHLKVTQGRTATHSHRTEHVTQECLSRKRGDQSGHTKAPGAPRPRGGKSTKSSKAPFSPRTLRMKSRAAHGHAQLLIKYGQRCCGPGQMHSGEHERQLRLSANTQSAASKSSFTSCLSSVDC